MARLYDAFNALALGNAINSMHNERARQKISGLQALGDSLQDYFQQRDIEQKEAAQKQSALDYLIGTGRMDEGKANGLVGSIGPGEAVKYFQGRLDDEAKIADERKYETEIHNRDRKESQEDKIEDLKNKIAFTEFGDLNNRIATLMMKVQNGSLPSAQDIQEMNSLKRMRNEWLQQHPMFSQIFFTQGMEDSDNPSGNLETKEAVIETMQSLLNGKDQVSPKALNDLNTRFLWATGHNLFNDPEYKDMYAYLNRRQSGSKAVRPIFNPDAPQTETQGDARAKFDAANWAAHINSLAKQIDETYGDRTHTKKFPNLNEKELAAMKEIFKKDYWKLNHYLKK